MTEEKITIWYLAGGLGIGGTGRTRVELWNNLDREKFDFRIFILTDKIPLAEYLEDDIVVTVLDAKSKADMRVPLKFAAKVRRHEPDILQSQLFFDNNVSRLAGLASNRTKVITGVRCVPDDPKWIRSLINRSLVGLSNHIVSNSKAGAELAIDRGADRENVSVIYNGRDLEEFENAKAPAQLWTELGIPEEATVVGNVGRLITRKGHYDLLEAWPTVVDSHPDAHLLLVGGGPEEPGLRETAHELDIADTVTLAGYRDDVPELLDLMDVFVFPSHYEGLPGALLEAMGAGLPIVTTPVDGNSELVVDGESGLYVEPKSPSELAERLQRLMSESAFAEKLGKQAQTRAIERFSTGKMVEEFQDLYVKVHEHH